MKSIQLVRTYSSNSDTKPVEDQTRLASLLVPIEIAVIGLLLVAIPVSILSKDYDAILPLLCGVLLVSIILVLTKRGHVEIVRNLLMFTILFIVNLLVLVGQGIHDVVMITFPIVLILSSMILERRAYILITILTVLSSFAIGVAELTGILVNETSSHTILTDAVLPPVILGVTAVCVRFMADHLTRSFEQARQLTNLQSSLIDEVRRRAEHLSILNRIGAALTSGLDLEHVLKALHRNVSEVAPNDTFSVGLYDRADDSLSFPIFIDLGEALKVPTGQLRAEPGLTGAVIDRRSTIYLPDLHDVKNRIGLSVVTLGKSSTRSYIGVPLFLHDEVIGVMSVQSQTPNAYQPDQIRLLETVGNHAAIAIQNARLYAALHDELEERRTMEFALHKRDSILEAITLAAARFLLEPDWRLSFPAVMGRLGQEIGSTHACIFQADLSVTDSLCFRLVDEWSSKGLDPKAPPPPYRVLNGTPGEWSHWLDTLQSGKAYQGTISSLDPAQHHLVSPFKVQSFLNVPILSDNELWGFLGFYDMQVERAWSHTEIDAIQIAVGLLAAAIQRQRDDERIRSMNAELEQRVRDRTSDLEAFAYSVAHDLRAPLRGLDGYSKLLLEEFGSQLEGDANTYLINIRTAARWMGQLIEDLLKLSRVTRVEMHNTRVDLSRIASETLSSMHKQSPERRIEWTVQPGMIVSGDPNLLRLALDNLLINAWKFTGHTDPGQIEVGSIVYNGSCAYFVRDNGIGFDMRFADKLFMPFQRLHQQGDFEGTGIGLATVKRIIQRHSGDIWVESSPSAGATFYFTLSKNDNF